MLVCPDCSSPLWPREVTTSPGGKIQIDHCKNCGGAWFDHWEINRLPLEEAKKIFWESPKAGREIFGGPGLCPHCRVPLRILHLESVPPDLNIFACPQCQGNWFSHKTLWEFKKAQAAKIEYFKAFKIPLSNLTSVLLPLFLFAILGLGLGLGVLQVREAQEIRTRARQLIGQPQVIILDQTSVIVAFQTSRAVTSQIEYWQAGIPKYTLNVSPAPQTFHQIKLAGLAPKVTYSYHLLVWDEKGVLTTSPVYTFTLP